MESYLEHYLLALFQKESTKANQLIHIFNGKRTQSIFYIGQRKALHHAFHQFPQMQLGQLEQMLNSLKQKGYLSLTDEIYQITHAGLEKCQAFFKAHFFPEHIKTYTYTLIRKSCYQHLHLVTQIISNFSFQETNFTPIVKDFKVQDHLKIFLNHYERNKLIELWADEQIEILQKMEKARADYLANLFSGYQMIGLSEMELITALDLDRLENRFLRQDATEHYWTLARELHLPCHEHLFQLILKSENQGLSRSTYESMHLMTRGSSVTEIAKQRRLKESTIREHILECAFVRPEFDYLQLIDPLRLKHLSTYFEEHSNPRYHEAKKHIPELEFMEYRLYELERIRQNV